MKLGQITSYIDVAQVTIYAFWIFFAGLIFYLRQEDRREGYPLMTDPDNKLKGDSPILMPTPKVFQLAGGATCIAPRKGYDDREIKAAKVAGFPGAPYEPVGDPMLAAVGPGSFAARSDKPDVGHDGMPKIVPLRAAREFFLETRDPDPRGMKVVGGDRRSAGVISDVWVDRSEVIIRYLEVKLDGDAGTVLVPMTFATVSRSRNEIQVPAVYGNQFANAPRLGNPDQISMLEEDKVCAYYGAGTLYADPKRQEPLL